MDADIAQTDTQALYLFRGLWSVCSHLFAEGVARETERARRCHHGFGPPVLLKLTLEKLPSNLVVGSISVSADYRASWMSYLIYTRTPLLHFYQKTKHRKAESLIRLRQRFENAALFLLPWSLRFFWFMREPGSGEHESLSRGCLTRRKVNKNLSPNQGISTIRPSVLSNLSRKRTLSNRPE